jgi:glycine/D-amino acid oxidase-like deaminating enzyme
MDVDYLVIGQGISGSLLSRNLLMAGKSVMVIDEANAASASRVAGGIVNPVTGKRLVRSWMIEKLLPFALDTYRAIEKELNVTIVKQYS